MSLASLIDALGVKISATNPLPVALTPIELLSVAGDLPGAAVDLPGCTIAASTIPRIFQYTFTPSNAGVLSVILRKTGETDRTIKQYGGSDLGTGPAAGAGQPGEIKVPTGWSTDFRYSGADTGTFILDVFG
jgi:hypothetical protein